MSTELSGNLEPASRSKYRRAQRPFSLVAIVVGLIMGVGGGLYLSWEQFPVIEYDTEPWQLSEADKAHYVVAVMMAYAQDGDPVRAVERLLELRLGDDPIQAVADIACDLATTGYVDSASGLQAIRNMMNFYKLQGRSGCADTLIPGADTAQTPLVEITLPSPTLVPPASKTPTPPIAGGSTTATPTPFIVISPQPQSDFIIASINTFCDTELSGIIEVFVQDFGGDGLPGQAVRVRWDGGEDTFFTGLKPERGPAYADFEMEAGKGYTIEMPGRSDPSTQPLNAARCTTDQGDEAITSYRVVFRPTG